MEAATVTEPAIADARQQAAELLQACDGFVLRYEKLKRYAERGRVRGVHAVRGIRMAGEPSEIDLDAEFQALASMVGTLSDGRDEVLSFIRLRATKGMPTVRMGNDFWSVDRPTAHEAVRDLAELLSSIGQAALIRQQSTVSLGSQKTFVYQDADLFDELDPPEVDSVGLLSLLDLEEAKASDVASNKELSSADGPDAPRSWAYGGTAFGGMPPKPWKLAKHLYESKNRTASAGSIADSIEGPNSLTTSDGIKNWQRDANKFFVEKNIPHQIVKSGEEFTLEIAES